jgi:hypothetical protein
MLTGARFLRACCWRRCAVVSKRSNLAGQGVSPPVVVRERPNSADHRDGVLRPRIRNQPNRGDPTSSPEAAVQPDHPDRGPAAEWLDRPPALVASDAEHRRDAAPYLFASSAPRQGSAPLGLFWGVAPTRGSSEPDEIGCSTGQAAARVPVPEPRRHLGHAHRVHNPRPTRRSTRLRPDNRA